MAEESSLIIKVDSTSAKRATDDLDRLTVSSTRAEVATNRLAGVKAADALNTTANAARAAAMGVDAETLASTRGMKAADAIAKLREAAAVAAAKNAAATEAETAAIKLSSGA
jgi:hypothetical protein